ncbi:MULTISPECIES: Lar family restriction alleviation protein [unclassified Bradyrhizobium]
MSQTTRAASTGRSSTDLTHQSSAPAAPLPCPFCGSAEIWVNSDLVPKYVVCKKCTAFGPTAMTVTQATERWNRRVAAAG